MTLVPVIMCGGAGSRLWPRSRAASPKQFLSLVSANTMLAETASRLRLADIDAVFAPPVIICGDGQEALVQRDLVAAGSAASRIVIEPFGRNTAAVAAVAALEAAAQDADALVLLLPADHHIADVAGFWRGVGAGLAAARDGYLVTLGIEAAGPDTGYGYIRRGEALSPGVFKVQAFREKPDAETAAAYLETGEYDWNAGIFLFRADAMIQAFETHAPDILAHCRNALGAASRTGIMTRLNAAAFEHCPSEPVDIAIMEKAGRVAVVAPVKAGWNDVGSWDAIADLKFAGEGAGAAAPNVLALNCNNCLIESDGPLVAAIGLEDLVIVATADAILISRRGATQDVKTIVNTLKANGRKDLL